MSEEIKHPNTPNAATEQDKGRCAPAPGSEKLLRAVDSLMEIVEGTRGERWSTGGLRLVDTPEWCELYVAWCAIRRKSPNAAGEPQPRKPRT